MKNIHSVAEFRVTVCSYLKRQQEIMGGRYVLFLTMMLWAPSLSSAAEVDAPTVQRAIDRGVTYLRSTQNERGGWNEYGSQSCGLSSLCTLALLNAGVSRDDPDMVRAMRYLRLFEPKQTYSVALQTLVYCQLGAAGDLDRIRRNVDWLVENQVAGNAGARRLGGWSYGDGMGSGDPSNSQFAILALGAAKDRGIEIEETVFENAISYWKSRQRSDGGWAYGSSQPATGSMTSAGIASLIIARDGTSTGSSKIEGEAVRCCGSSNDDEDPIERGIQWLAKHFSTEVNPGGDSMTYFYYLYALERVGRLSGRRFIGGHDWYREGAEQLLELHDAFQGFWGGSGPMEGNRDIATSFALLFLSKGKRQVVVGQLQYDSVPVTAWRSHPEGLKQLVRIIERDWRRDLTWQTMIAKGADGKAASVEDLLQAPVIVIRGQRALKFPDDLVKNLGEYIEQGGTILFEADAGDGCGDASDFETSVRELCSKWFQGAKLDRLPPSHPVWFAEHEVSPSSIAKISDDFWVYGVQACCRTAVFYVPHSLSCRWELSDILSSRRTVAKSVREQIDASVRLGENIIAYATGRELKDKLEKRSILHANEAAEPTRGSIEMTMVSIDAGGEEARRAIPNAVELIRRKIDIDLVATNEPVSLQAKGLARIGWLWIHGRTEFEFTPEERKQLGEYIQNGGFVFATAICGSEAFATSFRREMRTILPESPLESMASSHAAFTPEFGGFDCASVSIRNPTDRGTEQVIGKRLGTPVMEYAMVDNIASVFFSPLDVSCALESQNSVQCPGYPTDDAAKIVANMLLYGLNQ